MYESNLLFSHPCSAVLVTKLSPFQAPDPLAAIGCCTQIGLIIGQRFTLLAAQSLWQRVSTKLIFVTNITNYIRGGKIRGEMSAFYTEFEQSMESYRSFCFKSMWRNFCSEKICVEKKWQMWGLYLPCTPASVLSKSPCCLHIHNWHDCTEVWVCTNQVDCDCV